MASAVRFSAVEGGGKSTGLSLLASSVAGGLGLALAVAVADAVGLANMASVAGGRSVALGVIVMIAAVSALVASGDKKALVSAIVVGDGSAVGVCVGLGGATPRVAVESMMAKANANKRAANTKSATTSSLPMLRCMAYSPTDGISRVGKSR